MNTFSKENNSARASFLHSEAQIFNRGNKKKNLGGGVETDLNDSLVWTSKKLLLSSSAPQTFAR